MPIISLNVISTNDAFRGCLGKSMPGVVLEVLPVLLRVLYLFPVLGWQF